MGAPMTVSLVEESDALMTVTLLEGEGCTNDCDPGREGRGAPMTVTLVEGEGCTNDCDPGRGGGVHQ